MLCESEMEVEQHTCWTGQDVVERCVCVNTLFLERTYQKPSIQSRCSVRQGDSSSYILAFLGHIFPHWLSDENAIEGM